MNQELLKKMVWENDFQSLCDCIERTMENIETILLWQANSKNPRLKHEAFIQKFSADKGVLQLIEVDQKAFDFKEDEDIYIRFNDRSLLFKANIRKMSNSKIQVLVPKKFRIIENRDNSRNLLIEQDIKVKVELDMNNRSRANSFDFSVFDLNTDGIAVVMSVSKVNNFKRDQIIYLTSFGEVTLDTPVRCKIAHISKVDRRAELVTSREYKMGMKFLDDIPFFMNSYDA